MRSKSAISFQRVNPMYKGYPESKFQWAIKKKQELQTMYIAI
jgi:hypothetical protein